MFFRAPVLTLFVMCTTRCAVSPGTRFVILTRSPAFGLSFEIRSVAVWKVLPGFVLAAVNVAVVEPTDVTPIKTRAESAIVATRKFVPRILVPLFLPARSAGLSCVGATIWWRGRAGMGLPGGTSLPHWDYDLRVCSAGDTGRTTCELVLVLLLGQLLPESGPAASPRLGDRDALLAPGAGSPPEHGCRGEADETRGR